LPDIAGRVLPGELIGEAGDSDTVGKPHLHIEARLQNGNDNYFLLSSLNIEDLLNTKFDSNNERILTLNCN
jgi:murein DD-endopeptidase MepM/ murein hydrolase activator NlpD